MPKENSPLKPMWNLHRLSNSQRITLRRAVGRRFGETTDSTMAYYVAVGEPPVYEADNDRLFACVCMDALWKPEEVQSTTSFEQLLGEIYNNKYTSESKKANLLALLDTPQTHDGFLLQKLANIARLMHNKTPSHKPNFYRLADDLRYWNSPDRRVQRRWIRTIYRQSMPTGESSETT